ncbi:hypothetical protein [Bradyrhizobium sp. SYSU BS000235]|uniref:hypothetical protein n=1 Tax=Bradyrhizobium sp. SYSU BS000235 TaxID=3411332 RepID=UPI003C737B7F
MGIDGPPGYGSRERDDVLQTAAPEIEDGRVSAIYITRNPDKLGYVAKRTIRENRERFFE